MQVGQVREVVSDKILHEHRHEGSKGEGDEDTWEKMGLGRGNSKCKSLRLGKASVLQEQQRASAAGRA